MNSLGPLVFLFVVSLTHVFKSWALGVTALRIPPPAAAIFRWRRLPRDLPLPGEVQAAAAPSPAPAWLCPLLPCVAPPSPRWLAGFPSPLRRAHPSTTGVLPLLSPLSVLLSASLCSSVSVEVDALLFSFSISYSVSVGQLAIER